MTHEGPTFDPVSLRQWFPGLRVFRAIGLASSLRSVLLGAFAVSVLLLCSLFLEEQVPPSAGPAVWFAKGSLFRFAISSDVAGLGGGLSFPTEPQDLGRSAIGLPWSTTVVPAWRMVTEKGTTADRVRWGLQSLVALVLWSWVGGAIAKRSALQFARDESAPLVKTLRWTVRRCPSALMAPSLPLGAVLILAGGLIAVGFVGRLPVAGELLLQISSPVLIALSALATGLGLITLICWPLMVAAVVTDDVDGFGGLSRAYSLVTGRVGYALTLFIAAAVTGILCQALLHDIARWTVSFLLSCLATGLGTDLSNSGVPSTVQFLVELFAQGWGVAYFWSSMTLLYLLLRLSVDGHPLHNVADLEDRSTQKDPFPVVGIPATDAK